MERKMEESVSSHLLEFLCRCIRDLKEYENGRCIMMSSL